MRASASATLVARFALPAFKSPSASLTGPTPPHERRRPPLQHSPRTPHRHLVQPKQPRHLLRLRHPDAETPVHPPQFPFPRRILKHLPRSLSLGQHRYEIIAKPAPLMSASKNTTSTPRSPIARPTPLPFQPQSSPIKVQQHNLSRHPRLPPKFRQPPPLRPH
jgi:hypothetical protein